MKRFRGGLVFKAHRLVYHPTLGLRVIKQKKKKGGRLLCKVIRGDLVVLLDPPDPEGVEVSQVVRCASVPCKKSTVT